MAKVSTNINLDPTLKKNAQELLRDLGMDLTTAITIFLRQTVREQGIPFEIKRERASRKLQALFLILRRNVGGPRCLKSF